MAKRARKKPTPGKKRFKVTKVDRRDERQSDPVGRIREWMNRMQKERGAEVSIIVAPAVPYLVDIAKYAPLVNRPLEAALDGFLKQMLTILAEEAEELHDRGDVFEIRDAMTQAKAMFDASLEMRRFTALYAETAIELLTRMLMKKYPESGP